MTAAHPVPASADTTLRGTAARGPAARGTAARFALTLIRAYQLARSGRVSPCRFTPTCSEYAAQALDRHGLGHGLRLTIGRLARCRPFGPYGADPVPE